MAKEEHFVGKVAQKALIRRGDEVLIVRDIGDVDTWELPGGRLNVGEDPRSGLAREMREELGIEIEVGNVIFLEQFIQLRSGEPHLALIYEAALRSPHADLFLQPDEVAEIAWVNAENWQEYRYFAEYKRALASYFAKTTA